MLGHVRSRGGQANQKEWDIGMEERRGMERKEESKEREGEERKGEDGSRLLGGKGNDVSCDVCTTTTSSPFSSSSLFLA